MTIGAITISIVNGTATDESLATRPTVPSTASPAACERESPATLGTVQACVVRSPPGRTSAGSTRT